MKIIFKLRNTKQSLALLLVMCQVYIHAFQNQDLLRKRGFEFEQGRKQVAMQLSQSNSTDLLIEDGMGKIAGSIAAPPRYKKHAHRKKNKKYNKQKRREMALEQMEKKRMGSKNIPSRQTLSENSEKKPQSANAGLAIETEMELEADSFESENKSYTWLQNHPALLLNADYQPMSHTPLSLWTWQDAVKSVFSGKVTVVDVYPNVYIRAANMKMPLPSVIALSEYAPHARGQKPAFTRKNVFLRDRNRCQYCNNEFRTYELTLDHVKPRCMGGRLTWENAVACCAKCNSRKGSLQVHQLKSVGMKLVREPRAPSSLELARLSQQISPKRVHPTWIPFLPFVDEQNAVLRDSVGNNAKLMNEMEE